MVGTILCCKELAGIVGTPAIQQAVLVNGKIIVKIRAGLAYVNPFLIPHPCGLYGVALVGTKAGLVICVGSP